jgi:endoglycosylceramidase
VSRAARAALALAGAASLLAACGDDDGSVPAPDAAPAAVLFAGDPLGMDQAHFRDAEGRAVILRGVNARVEGVFDVTLEAVPGGPPRTPLETIPELTPADCARMAELGFDFLRLPINWSGVEPSQGSYDEAYLLAVDAAIECSWNAGIYVLVDFHEDAYSKEIGEDGAPLWAIQPAPEMLLEGPLDDLTARRTSLQVLKAFDSFFATGDPGGLQAAFIDALAHVATRYAANPGVVGFEIFNEPPMDPDRLYPFTYAAATRLRSAAPKKLIFFEPPVFRNMTDSSPLAAAPFPTEGGVYAPHVYTGVGAGFTIADLEPSVANARAEADSWHTPLVIGEFGNGPDAEGMRYVGLEYDLQDKYLASSALWLWKEISQGNWGFFDHDEATGAFTERPLVVATVARPYAQRIAGTPTEVRWDAAAGTLSIAFAQTVTAPNVLAIPAPYTISQVTCDGVAVTTSGQPPLVEASCTGTGLHALVATVTK